MTIVFFPFSDHRIAAIICKLAAGLCKIQVSASAVKMAGYHVLTIVMYDH